MVGPNDELVLDLSSLSFIYPFLILPVCSLMLKAEQDNIAEEIRYDGTTEGYLGTILFPNGFDALKTENWNSYEQI